MINVSYQSEFDKDGQGFLRVIDSEDKLEYHYTDFSPYHAHSFIPCFNQPDIKGTFRLKVTAPSEWKIISNEVVESLKTLDAEQIVQFATTPLMSTYLFFLGAGPYVEWKDQYRDIPLSIFARKSLEKNVDQERMFKTIKSGLKYFETYFDYPYPYKKYDHIFIPDFIWGAMENPGALS